MRRQPGRLVAGAAFLLAVANREVAARRVLGAVALRARCSPATTSPPLPAGSACRGPARLVGAGRRVVGPVLGVGAVWVRGDEPRRIALGVAPLAGILIGEAINGLTLGRRHQLRPVLGRSGDRRVGRVGRVGGAAPDRADDPGVRHRHRRVATAFVVAYSWATCLRSSQAADGRRPTVGDAVNRDQEAATRPPRPRRPQTRSPRRRTGSPLRPRGTPAPLRHWRPRASGS